MNGLNIKRNNITTKNAALAKDGGPYCVYNSANGKTDAVSDISGGQPVVRMGCSCGDAQWRDFTESTTLHGLRYIWMKDASCSRRFLWLCLTLFFSGLMTYQIVDRFIYYFEWPVTVNVKINYNDSLQFPSVTVCNQNAFRATVAASMGRYQLISDMFENVRVFRHHDLDRYNATGLTFSDLYAVTGHTKEDMIVNCEWRGEKCGPVNFTEIYTDHGKCFTFNYYNDQPLHVDSPGSQDGLSLTLNVEQYEYMPGPHDAAGVKVLLHHRDQFPSVNELGFVLSAGTHSFVGMKLVSVENLPKPHGQCSSPYLRHFRHYSAETCSVECKSLLVKRHCHCRLYFLPDLDGTPVCTLEQYFKCYKPYTSFFRREAKRVCHCPVPCHFVAFDTSVSYAAASPLVADRFLASANRSALKAKYDLARDVNHRLRPEKRQWLEGLTANLGTRLQPIQRLIKIRIESKLLLQKDAVKGIMANMKNLYTKVDVLFRYQHYIVKKDFTRARTAMDERTFSHVAMGMQEFLYLVDSRIRQLNDSKLTSQSVRQVLYLDVVRKLDAKMDISRRAYQNYTQFRDALVLGQPIFNYSFRSKPRNESAFIVPVPLFRRVMTSSRGIQKRIRLLGENIEGIVSRLADLKDLANSSYHTGFVNESDLFEAGIHYLYICREYLQSRDMFLYDVPSKIHSILENRESLLNELWLRFQMKKDNILTQVMTLTDSMGLMRTGVLGAIVRGVRMAEDFLRIGSLSKKDVARQFMKEDIQETQSRLRIFFSEVRTRGHTVFDAWTDLQKAATDMWTLVLDDVNIRTYLEFKNMTDLMVDKRLKEAQLARVYGHYKRSLDLRNDVQDADTEFMTSLTAMMKEMSNFQASEEIDANFLQTNILRLNIFYRELSYEQIAQQEAYDVFALLCDIGGSMGLFLGASVLTIIEILDLLAYTYGQRLRKKQ